jgi:hypothetical protein
MTTDSAQPDEATYAAAVRYIEDAADRLEEAASSGQVTSEGVDQPPLPEVASLIEGVAAVLIYESRLDDDEEVSDDDLEAVVSGVAAPVEEIARWPARWRTAALLEIAALLIDLGLDWLAWSVHDRLAPDLIGEADQIGDEALLVDLLVLHLDRVTEPMDWSPEVSEVLEAVAQLVDSGLDAERLVQALVEALESHAVLETRAVLSRQRETLVEAEPFPEPFEASVADLAALMSAHEALGWSMALLARDLVASGVAGDLTPPQLAAVAMALMLTEDAASVEADDSDVLLRASLRWAHWSREELEAAMEQARGVLEWSPDSEPPRLRQERRWRIESIPPGRQPSRYREPDAEPVPFTANAVEQAFDELEAKVWAMVTPVEAARFVLDRFDTDAVGEHAADLRDRAAAVWRAESVIGRLEAREEEAPVS